MTAPVGSLAAYLSVRGAAQARQDILSVQRQLGLAGEAATAAGGALDQSEAALSGVARASTITTGRTNQLRAAQLQVVAATERYNRVLADEGATVGQVATSEASLIRAKERVASVTRTAAAEQAKATEVTRSTALANDEMVASSGRMGSAMGGTVKQLGLMFGGFELLKKGIDYGKEASKFQQQMLLIQTNAGQTSAEVKSMTGELLKLAGPLATSPLQLATSLYHVEQNGVHGAAAIKVVTTATKGAKVGMADLEETTNAMTAAVASGIPGVKNMDQAMGALIATVGVGDMKMSDLNEALGSGLLVKAKAYGLSLRDVGAALAVFGDNNIRGADAATMVIQAVQSMAKVSPVGAKALDNIGLSATSLRDDMQKGGLNKAILDLNAHLTAAGVTGTKVGGFMLDVFGKKQSAGITTLLGQVGRLETKYADLAKGSLAFGPKWEATTKTAAFAFKQFGVEIEAGAVSLETKALPAITGVGHALATGLPIAFGLAHEAMTPFIAGWHLLADIIPPVGHALENVGTFLGPLAPVFKFLAVDVLATWAAFKGYQAARLAIHAVADGFDTLKTRAVTGLTSMQAYGAGVNATMAGNATESQLTSSIMQAEFAKIEAAAMEAAAAIDKAAMNEAISFADMTAASNASTDAQVANAERAAAAATAQARESALAAATVGAAAEESALVVDEAGATAAIGWGAILGPLAGVALGIGLLVSMFHHSTGASKEAAAAAKAYTDALHDDSGKTTLVDTITKQLTDNKIPALIEKLNRELGSMQFTGPQFVNAIQNGGKAIDGLRAHLEAVAKAGTTVVEGTGRMSGAIVHMTPAAQDATKALAHLNTQYDGLTKAAKKDLLDTKTFAGASSSIDKLSQSTQVGSKTAGNYAQMLGIVVDKNGVAAVSADTLQAAVDTVSKAYNTATASGTDFLTALDSFSKSAGTASDRAAMIGSTLKAANGDALAFAGAMTGAYAANKALVDGFKSDSDKIAGLNAQIANLGKSTGGSTASNQLLAAQINKTSTSIGTNKDRIAQLNKEIAGGKLTASGLASAHRELANAQATGAVDAARLNGQQDKLTKTLKGSGVDTSQLASLQKQLADAYKNSELAAINLNKGTIDYSKGGAPALVGQLQAIQDASVKAAGATYQHELATKGATKAADDAFNQYRTQTEGTLIDEAKQLGLTHGQAKKLADTYFGLADAPNIKKTIEAIGTDPVVTVLDKIGRLLAKLTGQPWDIAVNVVTRGKLPHQAPTHNGQIVGPGYASGTQSATAGWHQVGEHGPEWALFNGGEKVLPTGQSPAGVGRSVVIQKLEVNQTYPLADTGKIGLTHALRAAATAMGGY